MPEVNTVTGVPVEGRGLGLAEPFLGEFQYLGLAKGSPAPSSSASQVLVGSQASVSVPELPAFDALALVRAGVSESVMVAVAASYERMYLAYCASFGAKVEAPEPVRSRPRRRRSSGRASVTSTSVVSSVSAREFDVESVRESVDAFGSGFCYLWFFLQEHHLELAARFGPNPTIADLAAVDSAYWRSPQELQYLGVREVRAGYFHVYPKPTSGAVRAVTFLRSARGFSIPWVARMFSMPCTMPGVVPSAVVGAGELTDKMVARTAPVAVFEGSPVYKGCVMGAVPTGEVVQFCGAATQLVGMETRDRTWWALNGGQPWAATRTVSFSTPRRLPALQGEPDVTWEGYSYLSLVATGMRPWVAGLLQRSPTVAQVASLPVLVVDLVALRRSSFTCSDRGLTLWVTEPGVSPADSFVHLLTFSLRQDVPVLGTLGAYLVAGAVSEVEMDAADGYARWVTRRTSVVGSAEVRMPFQISSARLV